MIYRTLWSLILWDLATLDSYFPLGFCYPAQASSILRQQLPVKTVTKLAWTRDRKALYLRSTPDGMKSGSVRRLLWTPLLQSSRILDSLELLQGHWILFESLRDYNLLYSSLLTLFWSGVFSRLLFAVQQLLLTFGKGSCIRTSNSFCPSLASLLSSLTVVRKDNY